MRRLMCVWCVLLLPALASAQTHPCDQATPSTQTVTTSAPYKVQLCARPVDAPEALTVYANGVAVELRSLTLVVAANAAGYALYEGPRDLSFPVGTTVLEVTVWNREFPGGLSQESPKSSPLALSGIVANPVPAAPQGVRIVR